MAHFGLRIGATLHFVAPIRSPKWVRFGAQSGPDSVFGDVGCDTRVIRWRRETPVGSKPRRGVREHAHFFGEAFFAAFFLVVFFVAFGFLAAFLVLFLAAFGMVSEVFKPKKLGSMSAGGDFRSTGQKMSNLSGIVGVLGAQH